jgi:uncharacterized SAM-binding protein YcdF (DUF218 family)
MTQETFPEGATPIKQEGRRINKPTLFKWLFFLIIILYILVSQYHAPILTALGSYLVLEHPAEKSDLIVCLAGGNVSRGLATADAYHEGLAPAVYTSKEEPPDGYEMLKERGIEYPETIDLMLTLLEALDIPREALHTSQGPVKSTFEEAVALRDFVKRGKQRSLILITSPTHSRRAWLTFKKVFEDMEVRILMRPSPYTDFRPEDWWKRRRYVRAVIIEYQKLIYYFIKYLI